MEDMILPIIICALLLIVVIWIVGIYNGLVALKHNISEAWSNIDVLLKQRYDELPKLVEACKQYMSFEQETLSRVIEARNLANQARATGNVAAVGTAEVALKGAVTQLFGLAESYPDLKANNNFQQLMTRISALEDSISDRREFYNEAVNLNNTRREEFPDLVLARMFGFAAADLLTFEPEELKDVDIGNLFDR